MAELSDGEKSEVVLSLNVFNKPAEATGVEAWVKLITNLIFMQPGAYPTDPEMGCDIGKYQFHFINDAIDDITELITTQVNTYLPDIPLTNVNVSKASSETGAPILVIGLEFSVNDVSEIAVVAANKVSGNVRTAFSL